MQQDRQFSLLFYVKALESRTRGEADFEDDEAPLAVRADVALQNLQPKVQQHARNVHAQARGVGAAATGVASSSE